MKTAQIVADQILLPDEKAHTILGRLESSLKFEAWVPKSYRGGE